MRKRFRTPRPRGGLSLRVLHLALKRGDGRYASGLQCAWRCLIFWVPLALLLELVIASGPTVWPAWPVALGLYLVVGMGTALWTPTRALTDRLTGTYLVPR
jgi:hypothetical protein